MGWNFRTTDGSIKKAITPVRNDQIIMAHTVYYDGGLLAQDLYLNDDGNARYSATIKSPMGAYTIKATSGDEISVKGFLQGASIPDTGGDIRLVHVTSVSGTYTVTAAHVVLTLVSATPYNGTYEIDTTFTASTDNPLLILTYYPVGGAAGKRWWHINLTLRNIQP